MTEFPPTPFDPDAPPAPACTFGGLTLRHTAAGPAWTAPESRPESAVSGEDTGPGPVYVYTESRGSRYRDSPDPDDAVYTLATTRGEPGWNTDGGYPGYGLTLSASLFYRDAANAAIAAGAVFPVEEGDA